MEARQSSDATPWSEAQVKEMARRAIVAVSGLEPSESELEDLFHRDLAAFVAQQHPNRNPPPAVAPTPAADAEAAAALAERHGLESATEALAWCGAQPDPQTTLASCTEAYLSARVAAGCAASSVAVYRLRFTAFLKAFGDRTPCSVTPAELVTHLNQWERENTRRSHWSLLHSFFRWLTNVGYTQVNPVRQAMRAPKRELSAGIVYTPYEVMRVLHEVMFTDQVGFWVLSLYAGMRIKEIQRLQQQHDPWRFIDRRRKEIRLTRDITGTIARVILVTPVLAEWLRWVRKRKAPFFPSNHWKKYPVMQAFALGSRLLSRVPRRRKAAPARLRAVGVPRRTYVAYRMAISGTDLALTADEVNHAESYLRSRYAQKVSLKEAEEFFGLTPAYVRQAAVGYRENSVQIKLKFRRLKSKRLQMASDTKFTPAEMDDVRWVLPNGRASEVVRFEEQMIRFFVDAADLLGVPKSLAAVYGVIFATPEPLSFSEISAKLSFSNGSVSQALRILKDMGAVRSTDDGNKVGEGKGRAAARERFVPDLELRKLVGRFIEQRLEKQLDAGSSRLDVLKRTVPSGDKHANAELARRLKSLSDWHTRARQLLPVARTVLRITP